MQCSDCDGGDAILSRCLTEETGIFFPESNTRSGFHNLQYRTVYNWEHLWPSKEFTCVCPVTAHHLHEWEMQRLFEIEKELTRQNKAINFGNLFNHIWTLNTEITKITTVNGNSVLNFGSVYEWDSPERESV